MARNRTIPGGIVGGKSWAGDGNGWERLCKPRAGSKPLGRIRNAPIGMNDFGVSGRNPVLAGARRTTDLCHQHPGQDDVLTLFVAPCPSCLPINPGSGVLVALTGDGIKPGKRQ